MSQPLTTHSKALEINLDPARYGSFAEIGAGQEVGRWFFRVGAAAGTIAKTISAYDKQVSDAIYGTAKRYVSIGRLEAMLEYEYALNVDRLDRGRGTDTAFFAFADTVSAQTWRGDADCHGWMGIRFQRAPRASASQIVLHTRMLDRDALMQHEALGVLGVNLVYGACRLGDDPHALLGSLLDNLGPQRIEVDLAEFTGAGYEELDHRLVSYRLVESGLTQAAMFSAKSGILRPTEVLYKRPVLLQRGRFRPPTIIHFDIQRRALERFCEELRIDRDRVVSLVEIDLSELRRDSGDPEADLVDRIRALTAADQSVLLSDYPAFYRVAQHLARYSATQIALPMGIASLLMTLDESRYRDLRGGLLEACGRLFGTGVHLYVYPGLDPESGARVELGSVELSSSVRTLFRYLLEQGYVRPLEGLPDEQLRIRSDDVFEMIRRDAPGWEECVPIEVAGVIRERGLFGLGTAR